MRNNKKKNFSVTDLSGSHWYANARQFIMSVVRGVLSIWFIYSSLLQTVLSHYYAWLWELVRGVTVTILYLINLFRTLTDMLLRFHPAFSLLWYEDQGQNLKAFLLLFDSRSIIFGRRRKCMKIAKIDKYLHCRRDVMIWWIEHRLLHGQ